MASPKTNVKISAFEVDNKMIKSEDGESSQSQSSFVPTPEAKSSEEECSNSSNGDIKRESVDIKRESVDDDNKDNNKSDLKDEKATTPIATPAPSIPDFDFVKAAENVLADAKKLKAYLDSKPATPSGAPESKPNNAGPPGPPMMSPEETMLRGRIMKLSKKIAFETGPAMPVLMSDMVTVSAFSLSSFRHFS